MTDKLKCPFCGATLKEGYNDIVMSCFDTEPCPCHDGFKRQIYNALIDGKKAQDALKKIKTNIKSAIRTGRNNNLYSECRVDSILDDLYDAEKEITSITKQ